ncbi:hypothetical protein BH24ACT21_BH24ACT21_15960 [soil metagenome]|jgi:hypothetical protein
MRTLEKPIRKSVMGCEELGQKGLIETSQCCERCHSADEYASVGSLGPCRATLSDGLEAMICCSGRKQLQGKVGL